MKITFLLPMILLSSTPLWSQVFVNENNQWHNADAWFNFVTGEIEHDPKAYRYDTGVEIGGTNYHQLLTCKIADLTDCEESGLYYRQENNKVFLKFENDILEYLIYDFSLQVNDTFILEQDFLKYELQVLEIDSVVLSTGEVRKRWRVINDFMSEAYIIEGIGSMFAPMNPIQMFTLDSWTELWCFFVADSLQYASGWGPCDATVGTKYEMKENPSFKIFPVPFKSSFHLLQINDPVEVMVDIMDFHGRVILSRQIIREKESMIDLANESSGIYFLRIFSGKSPVQTMKVVKM